MKISVTTGGKTYTAKQLQAGDQFVVAESGQCPHCEAKPLRAYGCGSRQEGHDTITEACRCKDCGQPIGTVRVKVDSLFGIAEDRKVLNGPWKVY